MLRSITKFAALAFVAGLIACTEATGPGEPNIEETNFAPTLGVDLASMTKSASGLYWKDVTTGTGATAALNQRVHIHYVGSLSNGTQFDDNVPGDTPFPFIIGAFQVIDGIDEGVRGMKVGGTRQLVIPPRLGYGTGPYGSIPGNSILVFNVTLVAIQ